MKIVIIQQTLKLEIKKISIMSSITTVYFILRIFLEKKILSHYICCATNKHNCPCHYFHIPQLFKFTIFVLANSYNPASNCNMSIFIPKFQFSHFPSPLFSYFKIGEWQKERVRERLGKGKIEFILDCRLIIILLSVYPFVQMHKKLCVLLFMEFNYYYWIIFFEEGGGAGWVRIQLSQSISKPFRIWLGNQLTLKIVISFLKEG